MSDEPEVTIEMGQLSQDSRVLVDGEQLPGVHAVEVEGEVGEITTAKIHIYPDEVLAKTDAENVEIVRKMQGDE